MTDEQEPPEDNTNHVVVDCTNDIMIAEINSNKEDYNKDENYVREELQETLTLTKDIIKTVKEQFDEVTSSNRHGFKYTNLYAESLTSLLRQKTSILKDLSTMNEKRLLNYTKLRAELSKYKSVEKDDEKMDITAFNKSIKNMFTS